MTSFKLAATAQNSLEPLLSESDRAQTESGLSWAGSGNLKLPDSAVRRRGESKSPSGHGKL